MPVPPDADPRPSPRLLVFDTASERLAVAAIAGERETHADEEGAARSSQRLLPLAIEQLDAVGLRLEDLQAVAFGRGPGAFTGLRSACSVAQGLALGLGCPVLALDSLAIWAEDAYAQHGVSDVWVAVDARMDEAYAAPYRRDGAQWTALRPPALWTLPALVAAWRDEPPRAVAGNALLAFGERLPCGDALHIHTLADRAAALARLARTAWAHGERLDAADALPLYLRDKVALTTAERGAQRAAAAT
jgi:tRNA threonylcarbamoyladenosine biosynthesis protein TsaB